MSPSTQPATAPATADSYTVDLLGWDALPPADRADLVGRYMRQLEALLGSAHDVMAAFHQHFADWDLWGKNP